MVNQLSCEDSCPERAQRVEGFFFVAFSPATVFTIPFVFILLRTLLHFFALLKNSTLLFSRGSTLFAKNTRGGEGSPLMQSHCKGGDLPLMVEWRRTSPTAPTRRRKRSNPIPMTKNYLDAAIEIAQEAGKILVEEFSRPMDIRYKGDEVDLVTQADKRSEQAIVARLNKYFPDHAV